RRRLRLSRGRVRARAAPGKGARPRARARCGRQRPARRAALGAAHARHARALREARLRAESPDDGTRRYDALNSLNRSWPCSHTDVGGETGTSSGAPPNATRSFEACGWHGPVVASPVPFTSGEKRASAEAESPGCRTMRAAVAVPGCSATTCVGRSAPFPPTSCTFGSPETKHATGEVFVTVRRYEIWPAPALPGTTAKVPLIASPVQALPAADVV